MALCERCGGKSNDLKTLMTRGNAGRKREKVCPSCLAEAYEHTGMSATEIAQDNARWDGIFARFIDPDYYKIPAPTFGSSFGAFASRMEMLCR
jgi:hypothetical protein